MTAQSNVPSTEDRNQERHAVQTPHGLPVPPVCRLSGQDRLHTPDPGYALHSHYTAASALSLNCAALPGTGAECPFRRLRDRWTMDGGDSLAQRLAQRVGGGANRSTAWGARRLAGADGGVWVAAKPPTRRGSRSERKWWRLGPQRRQRGRLYSWMVQIL